jgi:hypothetical protein
MGREVKRVPLDFSWPMNKTWEGYEAEEQYDPPEGDGYQLWETVSEGSAITPVFATKDELADWLVFNGDPVHGKLTKQIWLNMIEAGWCPSMIIVGGRILSGPESASLPKPPAQGEAP